MASFRSRRGQHTTRPACRRTVVLFVAVASLGLATSPASAVPSWTIQPSSSPALSVDDGELNSVICPGVTTCVAVGSNDDRALIRRYDGVTWTGVTITDPLLRLPAPQYFDVHSVDTHLESTACTTTTNCFAVGFDESSFSPPPAKPLVVRFGGTAPQVVALPSAIAGLDARLHAVSCTANMCFAAGDTTAGATVIVRWNGTSWSRLTSANVPGATSTRLNGVKCTTNTNCVAVGMSVTGGTTRLHIQRWNGSTWSIIGAPNPANATRSVLRAVACPASNACFAVGDATVSGTQRTLIERWNGTAWSLSAAPSPAGTPVLRGVGCAGASMCFAVGTVAGTALVLRWNGTAWSQVAAPGPTGSSDTQLGGVNCITATNCFAVGHSGTSPFSRHRLVEKWTGSAWSIVGEAASEARSAIEDVDCPGAANCIAVGWHIAADGRRRQLTQHSSANTWVVKTVPVPAGATSHALFDISCTGTMNCLAVGSWSSATSAGPLVVRWNGSVWTLVPHVSDGSVLLGIACSAPTTCWAVGSTSTGSRVERWNGTSWTVQAGGTVTGGRLVEVACANANLCIGVGSRDDPSLGLTRTLAVRWNGSSWAVAADPSDPALNSNEFSTVFGSQHAGVSCPTTTSCFVVGHYTTLDLVGGDFYSVGLIRRWTGGAWSAVTPPHGPWFWDELHAVSCPTTTSCTVVGSTGRYDRSPAPWAIRWNGSSWSAASPLLPPEATRSELEGVDCTSANACTAVGWTRRAAGSWTLVERYA